MTTTSVGAAAGASSANHEVDMHGSSEALTATKHNLVLGYRILGMHGLGLGLLAHLTARVPGANTFWTYSFGQSVEEVTLQTLAEVDFDGKAVDPEARINQSLAAHGPIYRAHPEVLCIAHHHGDNGVAAGAIGTTLLPIDNQAARWHGDVRLVQENYEEASSIPEQGEMMASEFATAKALLLKHHGLMVAGGSVQESVVRALELEASLGMQLKAMAAGTLHLMPDSAIKECKKFLNSDVYFNETWAYLCRRLKREGLDDGLGF